MKPPPNVVMSPGQRNILRNVSRSFDLSIRLLPSTLQAPVAIGYLLARATDTVADTAALDLNERRVLLNLMTQVIATPAQDTAQTQEISRLSQAFAAQQTDPHERALMQALPQCLPLIQALDEADQASVRQVLGHITRGQQGDMTRFGPGLNALNTQAELEDYTWCVAGSVGEFWTELCTRHLPGHAHLPQAEMMQIGREYGKGLQRLNILRDAGTDLAAGRCYFPIENLTRFGLTPQQLAEAASENAAHSPATLKSFEPLFSDWLDHTQTQLAGGMRYATALKPLRLRLASALPALIGARTVALLRQTGPAALTQRIKMPRHEMRWMMWQIALGLGSAASLTRQFEKMSVH